MCVRPDLHPVDALEGVVADAVDPIIAQVQVVHGEAAEGARLQVTDLVLVQVQEVERLPGQIHE